jgi:hypothetical protein
MVISVAFLKLYKNEQIVNQIYKNLFLAKPSDVEKHIHVELTRKTIFFRTAHVKHT